jgi:hypothetical protein
MGIGIIVVDITSQIGIRNPTIEWHKQPRTRQAP